MAVCRAMWLWPLEAWGGAGVTIGVMPEATPYRLLGGMPCELAKGATPRSCWPWLEGREDTEVCPAPIDIRFPACGNTRGQRELDGPRLLMPGVATEDPGRQRGSCSSGWHHTTNSDKMTRHLKELVLSPGIRDYPNTSYFIISALLAKKETRRARGAGQKARAGDSGFLSLGTGCLGLLASGTSELTFLGG